jgi:hypothetical protein
MRPVRSIWSGLTSAVRNNSRLTHRTLTPEPESPLVPAFIFAQFKLSAKTRSHPLDHKKIDPTTGATATFLRIFYFH